MGSSGGKGLSDMIGSSFDPFGALFGDSLGFDVDPIGNMIGQSFANISGVITGERDLSDVGNNFFGSNWIGDMANPMIGGKSRQMFQQEETNRMWQDYYAGITPEPVNEDLWTPFRSQTEAPANNRKVAYDAKRAQQGASLLTEDENTTLTEGL